MVRQRLRPYKGKSGFRFWCSPYKGRTEKTVQPVRGCGCEPGFFHLGRKTRVAWSGSKNKQTSVLHESRKRGSLVAFTASNSCSRSWRCHFGANLLFFIFSFSLFLFPLKKWLNFGILHLLLKKGFDCIFYCCNVSHYSHSLYII